MKNEEHTLFFLYKGLWSHLNQKIKIQIIFVFFLFIGISNISYAEDFKIEFSWEGLKLCNTGSPFIVSNPIFKVSGLPKGTEGIEFRLQDLYAPSFNHGGGWIEISKDGTTDNILLKNIINRN